MTFVSFGFIAFAAFTVVVCYALPAKAKWPALLVLSLGIYASVNPLYLIFISAASFSAYLAGIAIGKQNDRYKEISAQLSDRSEKRRYKDRRDKVNRRILVLSLLFCLGILAVTKYSNFVLENISKFTDPGRGFEPLDILIPMGISYYTFQTVSYVIDTYRGGKPEKNPAKLLLFTCFFPQLVQGPISRYKDLAPELFTPHKLSWDNITAGLIRISFGYFKKVVIADRMITAVRVMSQDTENYSGIYVFILMIFYAIDLYADFTGGIDITVGIARLMGIRLKENFNLPFFSKNIKEYWNRWHITMGSWFTDYIFYPMSVSRGCLKLSKWSREHLGNAVGKRVTVYLSALAVWLFTGIWHGAAWNFIVWGLLNFVVIMISRELEPLYAKFHKKTGLKDKKPYAVFEMIRTFILMSAIRILDVYGDVPLTFRMVGGIFTPAAGFSTDMLLATGLTAGDFACIGAGSLILLISGIVKYNKGDIIAGLRVRPFLCCSLIAALVLVTLTFGAYGIGYDSSQFIYNKY